MSQFDQSDHFEIRAESDSGRHHPSRRQFLGDVAAGFSAAALGSVLGGAGSAIAATATAAAQASAAELSRFAVLPGKTFQTMVGFGAGFNEATLKAFNAIRNPQDRARAYDLLYGDSGTRLNIVRLTVSPNAKPLSNGGSQGYDWAGDPATQSTWAAVQPVLGKTKPIFYAVPFTPPARWKTSGQLTHGGALRHEHYRDYADYLADFIDYHRKAVRTEIDLLSLQNEPGISAPWASCIWTGSELRDFLKVLGSTLRARGLKTQLMLSEGTSWTGAWDHLAPALQDREARDFLGTIASHSYGPLEDNARKDFAAASDKSGLPVWMSEMSLMLPPQLDDPGMRDALRIADYLHRDLVEAQASAWIYCFAIFTYAFKGSMGVLSPADEPGPRNGTLVVPKRLWALAHYSRFVRPGWKRIQVDGSGLPNTAFVSHEGERFVIVALNDLTATRSVTYDFGELAVSGVEAVSTTADRDMGALAAPRLQPHGFAAGLPASSITTFVGRLG